MATSHLGMANLHWRRSLLILRRCNFSSFIILWSQRFYAVHVTPLHASVHSSYVVDARLRETGRRFYSERFTDRNRTPIDRFRLSYRRRGWSARRPPPPPKKKTTIADICPRRPNLNSDPDFNKLLQCC